MISYTLPEIRRLLVHLILRHAHPTRARLVLVTLATTTPTPGPRLPLPSPRLPALSAVAVLGRPSARRCAPSPTWCRRHQARAREWHYRRWDKNINDHELRLSY